MVRNQLKVQQHRFGRVAVDSFEKKIEQSNAVINSQIERPVDELEVPRATIIQIRELVQKPRQRQRYCRLI